MLTPKNVKHFQQFILRWYGKHGRHSLPWRQTTNPYHILVSELMLQQTQVERVIPKYTAFLTKFPTVESLATASLAEVLILWQGLGYNRRAKFLWLTAKKLHTDLKGTFPTTAAELTSLPGIGPYTATAVSVFAYNNPETVIETNIRTVFLYHFFPGKTDVSDKQLLPIIAQTIWETNPREWYAALMDYGSYLKSVLPNPSRKSKHHTTQSKFEGSPRQVRGEIIRMLTKLNGLSKSALKASIRGNKQHFETSLTSLENEQMIIRKNGKFFLTN